MKIKNKPYGIAKFKRLWFKATILPPSLRSLKIEPLQDVLEAFWQRDWTMFLEHSPFGKKAFLPLLFTPIGLVLGILVFLFALLLLGFGFFLALNVLTLVGFLLVLLGGYLTMKTPSTVSLSLIGIGVVLILLPRISDIASEFTLGVLVS